MSDSELMKVFKGNYPELGERLKPESFMPRIKQIKGKQNEAPIEDYLPYVQDFVLNPVTSNPYSRVNDLENTGLIDLARLREHGLFDLSTPGARGRDINAELSRIYPAEVDKLGGRTLSGQYGVRIPTFDMMRGIVQEMPGNYATPSSLIDYLKGVEPRPIEQGYSKYWQDVEPPKEFAEGGAVDIDEAYEFRDFGLRQTGEPKEEGALGLIRMPDGMTDMTEYSINVDGKEMPSIIEGMHPADINYIRETGDVPEDAVRTAIHNARKREAQGKSPFYNRREDKGYAEGGKVKDPFANMSMLDKVSLLARGAKKRYFDHYDAASKHGAYPDQLAAALKDKYLVELGNSRQNRTPLDVAINYGGGYDFAANKAVPAQDVRDMAKAYQLFDYMTSIRDSAKADAIGDYYENMAGVEAGLAGRSRGRMPESEIQRLSAQYGKRKATAAPAYTEGEYAEGGLVYNDYDEMFEFR